MRNHFFAATLFAVAMLQIVDDRRRPDPLRRNVRLRSNDPCTHMARGPV